MIIHFLEPESMFTACGLSAAGREQLPVTSKIRDVTCVQCVALNN